MGQTRDTLYFILDVGVFVCFCFWDRYRTHGDPPGCERISIRSEASMMLWAISVVSCGIGTLAKHSTLELVKKTESFT